MRASLAALLSVSLAMVACSPERSVASFCATFEQESVRLQDKYQQRMEAAGASNDPLGALLLGMGTLLEAQGDFVVLFNRLEQVAPTEIQPEVAAVRDTFKQQAEQMAELGKSPFGALAASLISGMSAQGSYQRVDSYVQQHCDLSFMSSRPSGWSLRRSPLLG